MKLLRPDYVYPPSPKEIFEGSYLDSLWDNEEWAGEEKKSGGRCLIFQKPVEFFTRHNTRISMFDIPHIVDEVRSWKLSKEIILDCELFHESGREIKFASRIWQKKNGPLSLYCFGVLINGIRYDEAREILLESVKETGYITVARPVFKGKFEFYRKIKEREGEGMVLKRRLARIRLGKKACIETPNWLKVKKARWAG